MPLISIVFHHRLRKITQVIILLVILSGCAARHPAEDAHTETPSDNLPVILEVRTLAEQIAAYELRLETESEEETDPTIYLELGLLYAHPLNPEIDFTRAESCFRMYALGHQGKREKYVQYIGEQVRKLKAQKDQIVSQSETIDEKDANIKQLNRRIEKLLAKEERCQQEITALNAEICRLKKNIDRLIYLDIRLEKERRGLEN